MDNFKIVIDGKEHSCTRCDKVYVELDSSVERSDIDCAELNNLIESFSIPREPVSCTIHIKKKSPNYKRIRKFSRSYLRSVTKMRTDEELIADRNIRVVAQALIDIIHIFCHIHGCENDYIRELGRELNDKYGLELEEITNSGNGI